LALLTTTVPMLALPEFAVVGANDGTGADASKEGTGQNGGSNVAYHSRGHQYQQHNCANAPGT
jgi:hypothetical protein